MKHTPPVTTLLIGLFLVSQLFGLALVGHTTPQDIAPPTTSQAAQSGGTLLLGVALGTIALLVIIKLKWAKVWKAWFLLAVWAAMSFSIEVFIPSGIAIILAAALAVWKIFKPNLIIHNLTEILVYSGIVLLIVEALRLDLIIAAALLLVVALYDAYAVWKSKHMVKMAQFQSDSKLFAGLLVPYDKKGMPKATTPTPAKGKKTKTTTVKTAVLGGGDITFPLLFSATAMQWLISQGYAWTQAFVLVLPITVITTGTLAGLLILAKKDTFYPAMPFLAAGCFVGFAFTWGLRLISG